MSHSQHGEEEEILRYFGYKRDSVRVPDCILFGNKPRFLDIGAADGKTFSNTLALAERGWGGVCVEGHGGMAAACAVTHRERPNVEVVNAVIATTSGWGVFHVCNDLVSSTEEAHVEKWSKKTVFDPVHVFTITTRALLTLFPGPYHFVNIDTEGTSGEILASLDLDALDCRCLCVEHDGRDLTPPGSWERLYWDGNNVIFGRK